MIRNAQGKINLSSGEAETICEFPASLSNNEEERHEILVTHISRFPRRIGTHRFGRNKRKSITLRQSLLFLSLVVVWRRDGGQNVRHVF